VDGVPTPDPNAEWWTTTDVARYLGITVGAASTYRGTGYLPAPDRTDGKRKHLWKPARIIEWHAGRPLVHQRQLRHASENYQTKPGSRETAFTKAEGITWDDYALKLRVERISATERLGELFGVDRGTPLLVKHLVFFARDTPRQMSSTHLLAEMVDGTPVADPEREPWPGGTIDQMASLGVTVTNVEETVTAREPTTHERTTLELGQGVPVLAIVRRMFAGEKVVEVADEIVIPADQATLVYRFGV
jgi:GntR family transcriptional regulator